MRITDASLARIHSGYLEPSKVWGGTGEGVWGVEKVLNLLALLVQKYKY
jgi:hypothetical protein